MSTSTPAATAATQSKITAAIQRLAPSGTGFISAAVAAGAVYVANHVFHVTLGTQAADTALTPVIALIVGSIADNSKTAPVVAAEVTKVEEDPTVKLLAGTVESKLADPTFRANLTKLVLGELTNVEQHVTISGTGYARTSVPVEPTTLTYSPADHPAAPPNIAPGSPAATDILNANAPAAPNPNHPVA